MVPQLVQQKVNHRTLLAGHTVAARTRYAHPARATWDRWESVHTKHDYIIIRTAAVH